MEHCYILKGYEKKKNIYIYIYGKLYFTKTIAHTPQEMNQSLDFGLKL